MHKKTIKSFLTRATPVVNLFAISMLYWSKRLGVRSYGASQKVVKRTVVHSRTARYKVTGRAHEHLVARWDWYQWWHGLRFTQLFHRLVAGSAMLILMVSVLSMYGNVRALSDLFNTWDFTTPGNYQTSNGAEVASNSGRLKVQNYDADSNTMGLYHFDEANGTTVSDSSTNHNDGTLANSSFGPGVLNNALNMNGTTSSISVPNSSSLQLQQQNTLEAWTKFNNTYTQGSSSKRQAIMDKGDYQFYYNNENGKLTYELANKNANTWTLAGGNNVNGSWDVDGKQYVTAVVKMGSDYYYGIGGVAGDAEVWKWDGTNWTQIGGGSKSINGSWDSNTYEYAYSLATDGTNIYAGLGSSTGDGEVWKWNGSTWTKIGGDGVNSGWTGVIETVYSLEYFNGKLYAGLGVSANDAQVWQWNGSSWTQVGGNTIPGSWPANYEMVNSMTHEGNDLYAGLGNSAGDGEVWKWNGSSWTKIGGDGINSGWGSEIETVRSLGFYGGKLYAGLGDTAGDGAVWQWNGSSWTKIGGNGLNGSWPASTYEIVPSLAYDGTNIYAGLGNSNGDGEVWKWDGSSWTKIGGDGINAGWTTAQGDSVMALLFSDGKLHTGTSDTTGDGLAFTWDGSSWTQIGGAYVNKSWGYYGIGAVNVMQAQGDYLYAGTGNAAGNAMVFQFDGANWNLVGGQGVNNSWEPFTYEQVMSMASYKGDLYVGLGTTQSGAVADGQVWKWDGHTWTKIGGNGINSSWLQASHFGEVDSMAADNNYLYAGLGSAAGDGQVWRYNGTSWELIGTRNLKGAWPAITPHNIYSMAIYNGKLQVGLGRANNYGQVWEWNGSSWSQIGGSGLNSSWPSALNIQSVETLMPYNGKLYAGLGNVTGNAAVWEYDGSSWTKIGGDNISSSWDSGVYEKVKTIVTYNGDLYAGLGNSTGDGEVWRYNGSSWTKIGGNSLNGGWPSVVEEVESFSPYKGKLYLGTGVTTNADGLVWSWGDNGYLESTQSSFDNNWHHVAASYDGDKMKIYIDGVLNSQKDVNVSMPTSNHNLLIGTSYGGRESGKPTGTFDGKIDEVRISDKARSSFVYKPYSSNKQTITPTSAVRKTGVWHWDEFNTTNNGVGSIKYRVSIDGGTTWQYWNGSVWTTSANISQTNTEADVSAHISTLTVTFDGFLWQAVAEGNGDERPEITNVTLKSTSDTGVPSTAGTTITAQKSNGGTSLANGAWTNGPTPKLDWTPVSDSESGIAGYCVYLGQDNTADPVSTKGILGSSPLNTGGNCQFIVGTNSLDLATPGLLASPLVTSSTPYYVVLKAIDKAGNISSDSVQFSFKFDNTPPTNPGFISAPSGFVNDKGVVLSWATTGGSAPSDNDSGLAGLQYRIGASGTWYGASHAGTGNFDDLLPNNGSYTMQDPPDFANLHDGINTIYFRTWDNAGNISPNFATAAIKLNTSGAPSEPLNITATPNTNTTNTFSFSWNQPATFVGDANNISYCYTINTQPDASNCNFTGAGIKSLATGPYATKPGSNTIYVVAKDESGNINYASYGTATFAANTAAPGIPKNSDIVDVSIKSTSNWRLALTWDTPDNAGSGVKTYQIQRSSDNTTFSTIGSSSSTTYIDANLSQQTYYYKVRACDNTNNCGALGTIVSALPTGRFTEPANMVSQPVVSNISTNKASISWSTDRSSDSKILLGTSSGKYGSSEISNSDQVSAHDIKLSNLSAGTTYYFVAKWTDEDGNTGTSQEYTFRTAPPPTLKEVSAMQVGLSNATIKFTSKDATRIAVYFGPSESYGGLKTVNTSMAESTYTVSLDGLSDGTKYFYKLVSYDSDGNTYDGNVSSFTTPARPRISDLRFQPVTGKPTSTQRVTWRTNVTSSSVVTYGKVGTAGTDAQAAGMSSDHTIDISDLEDDSEYFLIAQSRDSNGNVATSDRQVFHTALDTRPPNISNVTIETSIKGTGAEARGQAIVSWKTDEPASSQVAYAEGSGATVFNSKTPEDSALSFEHIVIVSDLPTSKVYSLQPVSFDKARNQGKGKTETAIVGRASDSVLTIVLNSLKSIFGF